MAKMPQHYRAMYDADFWGAWDLESGDKTVTIKRVIGGELTGPGGKKSKKPVVYVEGSEKGIPLNKTNGKTIANMYGNYVTEWVGRQITLYKSSTRNPQDGGEIDCIRIRPEAPRYEPTVTLAQCLTAIGNITDAATKKIAIDLCDQLTDDTEIAEAKVAIKPKLAVLRATEDARKAQLEGQK